MPPLAANRKPLVFGEKLFYGVSRGCVMRKARKKVSPRKPPGRNWDRKSADILRDRLDLLDGNDRVLMKMYLEAGSSFRQMARLAGVNEVTVARRIRSTTRRLVNGQYLDCLRHREKLTAMELNVAKDYYLKALPMRSVSARRGWTYYRTQRTIRKIRRFLGETLRPIKTD